MSWARQERSARSEKEAGAVQGGGTPPRKIAEQTQNIFKEIFIFSQTNTPGRSSSDELGEAREVRPFNEILIFSQTNTPGRSSYDELGEAREARPFRKRSRGGPGGGTPPRTNSRTNRAHFP